MPILQRRGHVVTFRLSAQEYKAVYSICEIAGVRSVSEFVRGAVLERAARLATSTMGDLCTAQTAHKAGLEEVIRVLQAQVEEIAERVGVQAARRPSTRT
jgi:hypothetical protein